MIDRYAEIGDLRLHYVEEGEGPLVVMLHGFPEFWFSWRKQIPALAVLESILVSTGSQSLIWELMFMAYKLTVNGKSQTVDVPGEMPLLWVRRVRPLRRTLAETYAFWMPRAA